MAGTAVWVQLLRQSRYETPLLGPKHALARVHCGNVNTVGGSMAVSHMAQPAAESYDTDSMQSHGADSAYRPYQRAELDI